MIGWSCLSINLICYFSIICLSLSDYTNLRKLKTFLHNPLPFQRTQHIGPLLKELYSKNFNCSTLYHERSSTHVVWPPPVQIPQNLTDRYTLGGIVPIKRDYYALAHNGGGGYRWPKHLIERTMKLPCICGQYKVDSCQHAISNTSQAYIMGKVGAVIGSLTPWAEAALLGANSSSIITIEYMKIKTNHPKLSTLTPSEAAHKFLNGTWKLADFIWSYSSIEHDGLGRYGDPLNPYGDLEAMAKMYCLLKPGGILYLGVPMGPDALIWNAHRIYGALRLPLLLELFEVIDVFGDIIDFHSSEIGKQSQPVLVLRKSK